MLIHPEMSVATWPIKAKFTDLNVSEFLFLLFSHITNTIAEFANLHEKKNLVFHMHFLKVATDKTVQSRLSMNYLTFLF